jgi:hypothetical protein
MNIIERTITLNYDMAGSGSTTFDIITAGLLDLSKYDIVHLQVNYKDADVGDSTLEFQRSADGVRFVTPPGGLATMDTGAAKVSDMSHADWGAKYVRVSFTLGTDTAGTIETIYLIAKQKD